MNTLDRSSGGRAVVCLVIQHGYRQAAPRRACCKAPSIWRELREWVAKIDLARSFSTWVCDLGSVFLPLSCWKKSTTLAYIGRLEKPVVHTGTYWLCSRLWSPSMCPSTAGLRRL